MKQVNCVSLLTVGIIHVDDVGVGTARVPLQIIVGGESGRTLPVRVFVAKTGRAVTPQSANHKDMGQVRDTLLLIEFNCCQ